MEFLKNAWYCAGWDYQISQGKESIVAHKIAGKRVVLYRKRNGEVVAWIWVWMGDPAKADPALISAGVGPGDPDYITKPSYVRVNASYLLENANLAGLSHLSFTHEGTIGMGWATAQIVPTHRVLPRGIKTDYWTRNVPPPKFVRHLFESEFRCDANFDITQTYPCTWVMHFRVFTAGTATEGESDGQLVMDSWTSQAVTPRDDRSVDYYYSWGVSRETDFPGMADMLKEGIDAAFLEDKRVLEGQQIRIDENPNFRQMGIGIADAGPARMLRVIDQLIRAERESEQPVARIA